MSFAIVLVVFDVLFHELKVYFYGYSRVTSASTLHKQKRPGIKDFVFSTYFNRFIQGEHVRLEFLKNMFFLVCDSQKF